MGLFYQITDDAFPGAKSIDFIGQRIVYVEPFGRYWGWSDLVDASSWNSLETAQAETSPDRIQGLIVSHNEVLIFGERTIEPWASAPTDTAVFQLQVGSVIESGCASGKTIQRLDNSVFYLTNTGQVARLNGYTPQVISTPAMEAAIRDCRWSRAFAFTWEDSGHCVYYITFPDGHTWGYDVRQGKWHRRESFGMDRWRINALCKSNTAWYAGDYSTNMLYRMTWGYVYEGCEIMPRKFRTGILHDAGNRVMVHAMRLFVASGGEPSEPSCPEAPVPDTYLLVTGSAKPGSDYVFASAVAAPAVSFAGLEIATGANIEVGTPAYYNDGTTETWAVATSTSVRYSTDNRATWQTGTIDTNQDPKFLVGGAAGWMANTAAYLSGTSSGWVGATPAALTKTSFTGTFSNASSANSLLNSAHGSFVIGANYYRTYDRSLFRAASPAGPYTALWDQFKIAAAGQSVNGACIAAFVDICEFNGEPHAIIEWHFDLAFRRIKIVRPVNGWEDWSNLEVLVDVARGAGNEAAQLCVCGDQLVAYCMDGTIWTSANGWASATSTGLAGPGIYTGYDGPTYLNKARRIAYSAGVVFVIGAGAADGDKCVTSADAGLAWSAPITMPIRSAIGIVASDA